MKFSLTIFALFFSFSLFAQLPNGLGVGFQGYARKADGSAISNEDIRVKFAIYDKGAQQTVAAAPFTEEHNVTTDAYGVFTAAVGSINTATFNALQFEWRNYWLNVQVAVAGGNFVTISDKAFNVVPYAKAAGNGVPTGTIMPFGGELDKVPAGWTACFGQDYDPNDPRFERLFSVIGYNWGSNGNNFRVPYLSGVFLRGWGAGPVTALNYDPDRANRGSILGSNSGDRVGSYQGFEIQSHGHPVSDPGHNHNTSEQGAEFNRILAHTGQGTIIASDADGNFVVPDLTKSSIMRNAATGVTVNAVGGSETRPINASVLYIIKL